MFPSASVCKAMVVSTRSEAHSRLYVDFHLIPGFVVYSAKGKDTVTDHGYAFPNLLKISF